MALLPRPPTRHSLSRSAKGWPHLRRRIMYLSLRPDSRRRRSPFPSPTTARTLQHSRPTQNLLQLQRRRPRPVQNLLRLPAASRHLRPPQQPPSRQRQTLRTLHRNHLRQRLRQHPLPPLPSLLPAEATSSAASATSFRECSPNRKLVSNKSGFLAAGGPGMFPPRSAVSSHSHPVQSTVGATEFRLTYFSKR